MAQNYDLNIPAIEIRQGGRSIYAFGVDGKRLHEFTAVSRVHRDDDLSLRGYQRPEVLSHIRAIRRYVESAGAMLPNAVVLAFDSRVRFESMTQGSTDYASPGRLIIPIDEEADEDKKPAWLVDGQQRAAAIRDADIGSFPIAAIGFIADDDAEQRSQFILVNSTKPLPKGLIHELLPETSGELPAKYARRKLPAYVMMRLNTDRDSPFRSLIAMPTAPEGYIKDNSVLRMIENSLYEGALYQYRDPLDGSGDEESMLLHLKIFWSLVANTWPDAWQFPPRRSRLTHGAGIQSLGYVMDSLTEGTSAADLPGSGLAEKVTALRDHCAWTSGYWTFSDNHERRWNSLQNTPQDVRLLSSHLRQLVHSSRV